MFVMIIREFSRFIWCLLMLYSTVFMIIISECSRCIVFVSVIRECNRNMEWFMLLQSAVYLFAIYYAIREYSISVHISWLLLL